MIKKQGADSKKDHSSIGDEEIQLSRESMSEHDSIKSEKSSAGSMKLGGGKRVHINQSNDMQKIMPSVIRKAPQMNIMHQPKVIKRENNSFGP